MPGTIANAYVQILPSAEGMKSNLTKALGGEAEDAGKNLASKIGGGLKTGLGTAAKAAAVGIAAAGTAAVALGNQALQSYADYEQLIGGVETLFGDSAGKVIQDASQAFKTAGMSANDYMETSIQSAAALINSLGGDQAKAADLMGMSITDTSSGSLSRSGLVGDPSGQKPIGRIWFSLQNSYSSGCWKPGCISTSLNTGRIRHSGRIALSFGSVMLETPI